MARPDLLICLFRGIGGTNGWPKACTAFPFLVETRWDSSPFPEVLKYSYNSAGLAPRQAVLTL